MVGIFPHWARAMSGVLMLKLIRLASTPALAVFFASCGPAEPRAVDAAANFPAETPLPPKPVRKMQTPLPNSEVIAQELVKAISDDTKAQFFPPKTEENFPGGVRVAPEARAVLFPPTNAAAIVITAALEPDAWVHQAEYKTDGVAIMVDAIDANGSSIAKQELIIDPGKASPNDPPATLSTSIPPEADHIEIYISARGNGALDNTTVVISYE